MSISDDAVAELGPRFWAKVDFGGPDGYHYLTGANLGPCWVWDAATDEGGYGMFWVGGRTHRAHRIAFELEHGPVPEGVELDHLCRVHPCVRHTEAVTHAENVRRGEGGAHHAVKTHCPAGHEYAGDNLRIYRGRRNCRACALADSQEHRARKKVLA